MTQPRRVLISLLFLTFLTTSSCALLEPETRHLDPNDPTVAQLLSAAGDDAEAIRQALTEYLDAPVIDYEFDEGKLEATVQSAMGEAVETGIAKAVEETSRNPTPSGLLAGLLGGIGVGLTVLLRRAGSLVVRKTKDGEKAKNP